MNGSTGNFGDKPWRSGRSIRIAVILERYGNVMSPCSSIRLHAFTERFPADVRYILPEEVFAFKPSVILWNRSALPSVEDVNLLASVAHKIGAKLIYDLDDNLLAMEGHPERDAYISLVAAVRRSLQVAHEVWCSTLALVDVVSEAGANALHMPNDLDPVLWDTGGAESEWQPPVDDSVLRLVYMGTRTHDEDYRLLEDALTELERVRPGSFSLTLVGVNARNTAQHPWISTLSPPAHTGASYPAFVRWFVQQGPFDLGLAPLIDTHFNRGKSAIKVLDYAAIGLPTAASAVTGYREDFAEDRLLVENSVVAWVDVLTDVLDGRVDLTLIKARAVERVGTVPFAEAVSRRWMRCLTGLRT